ncbi:insulinase family protein [Patescibacteria group bacterium]|nr:insulinase family protein [Patescibacteria group bacterium]
MSLKLHNLPNNLKVLSRHVPEARSVTVLILIRTGSRYEEKRTNGLAHFAEHMFFKGTKKRPTTLEISSLIDGIGGEFNAFTSKEYTGYYIKARAKKFELLLDVLSDMIQNSKFDKDDIERERGVIFEELRMYLDTPMRHIGDVYENLLYGDQPLGWDIVGSLDSLKNIKREDFLRFQDAYYAPENMIVSIAGGVSHTDIKSITSKYLGKLKSKKTANYLPVKFAQEGPAVKLSSKKTEQAHFCLGVRGYPRGHKNHYKVVVLNAILGSSMSSRLFIQLRERRGLAYYVRSMFEEYHDAGTFFAQAGVAPGNIEQAIKVILEEYNKITTDKIGAEELKRAKENIKGRLVLELEDSREMAMIFGIQQLLEGKIRTTSEIFKKIDEVSAEDVKKVASEIFKKEKLNLAIIGPYKDEGKFAKILKL